MLLYKDNMLLLFIKSNSLFILFVINFNALPLCWR